MLEAIGHDHPVSDAAHRIGEELGRRGLTEALEEVGYEPAQEGDETRFRNCPFHLLKEQDRETTCAMNLALVEGMVEGAGQRDLRPVLAPEDGYCCVRPRSEPAAGTPHPRLVAGGSRGGMVLRSARFGHAR